VKDADCVSFLQWALPSLDLRWPGYRRVRGQVCKRIDRRIRALGLSDPAAYRTYLSGHAAEWATLDGLCSIPISRFYRDRAVFDALGEDVLPDLARRASVREPPVVRCWSAGCASGEEPYTLSLMWDRRIVARYPGTQLAVLATDLDGRLLERARLACYGRSSLRELPQDWIALAFERQGNLYCLRVRWKACVEFRVQDLRREQPTGDFDLVLCRNAAFTYFSEGVQRDVLARIGERLRSDGVLVIGRHERLPEGREAFWAPSPPCMFRKSDERSSDRSG
jgi:chemotaxis protein methyltransferase CheR